MFAPPSLVAALVAVSPQLQALPAGTRRRIAEAGDVDGPGRYVVVGAPSGLNVRDSGSTSAHVNATVPNGSIGSSPGLVDNGFTYVQWDNGKSGWSSVTYLAPEGQAPAPVAVAKGPATASPAPQGPDLAPGDYVVTTQTTDLNLRASPSTGAAVLRSIPKGEHVQASGLNQNYFAQVQYMGTVGWAAAAYLTPASKVVQTAGGDLVLSAADLLQLRAMLAAWSNATAGAPSYGAPSDLELTGAAAARQALALSAFQQWNNSNRGTNLRTDGVVDAATRDALVAWSAQAVGQAPMGPAGAPELPPAAPLASDGGGGDAVGQGAKAGGALVLLALLAAGAFFLVEQKKKRGGTAAA